MRQITKRTQLKENDKETKQGEESDIKVQMHKKG